MFINNLTHGFVDEKLSDFYILYAKEMDKLLTKNLMSEDISGNINPHGNLQVYQIAVMYAFLLYSGCEINEENLERKLSHFCINWKDIRNIFGFDVLNKERRLGYDNIGSEVQVYPEEIEPTLEQVDILEVLSKQKSCIYVCSES